MNRYRFHPRYVFHRAMQSVYSRTHPDHPWLTAEAIQFLDLWLKPTDVGVEWGSGRSTRWLVQRVGRLTSMEHDEAWYWEVHGALPKTAAGHDVSYHLVPCDLRRSDDPVAHPYIDDVLAEIPEGGLDFALVDGVARLGCLRRVLDHIKPGGVVILDNAERYFPNRRGGEFTTVHSQRAEVAPGWEAVAERLASWRSIHTSNGIWDTRIWVAGASPRL